MARIRVAVVGLLIASVLAVAACDRAPVDPLDPRVDLATLLQGAGAPTGSAPLSMPGLLHAAIHRVYTEQGMAAARALVADLQRLHQQVQSSIANGDRETETARLQALRGEEIRIVLSVFGDPLAARVLDAIIAEAAKLQQSVAELEAAGTALPRARELLAQISAFIAQSAAQLEARNSAAALDASARAAAAAEGIRHVMIMAARVPTVDLLFESALAQLRVTDAAAAARTVVASDALQGAADQAVRAADRNRAYAALKAVRDEQIRVVVGTLGDAAVQRLIQRLEDAGAEAEKDLERARSTGRDVYRLERMLVTARDLHARSTQAFQRGEAAAALDLGSHAATLINSLRATLAGG